MTAALPNSPDAEALVRMNRRQYVDFKLRQDFRMMAWMVLIFWIIGFEARYVGILAAVYLLILAAARYDHGRKWDRANAVQPSEPVRQPGT